MQKHQQKMNKTEETLSDAWLPVLKSTRILRFKNVGGVEQPDSPLDPDERV